MTYVLFLESMIWLEGVDLRDANNMLFVSGTRPLQRVRLNLISFSPPSVLPFWVHVITAGVYKVWLWERDVELLCYG